MKNENNYYFTDNFALICYLIYESCVVHSIDKTNPRRAVFIFEANSRINDLSQKFLLYQVQVEPRKYFNIQRDVKQMLYGQ
jgi:hypothetical protein